jgi:hypothetical protein
MPTRLSNVPITPKFHRPSPVQSSSTSSAVDKGLRAAARLLLRSSRETPTAIPKRPHCLGCLSRSDSPKPLGSGPVESKNPKFSRDSAGRGCIGLRPVTGALNRGALRLSGAVNGGCGGGRVDMGPGEGLAVPDLDADPDPPPAPNVGVASPLRRTAGTAAAPVSSGSLRPLRSSPGLFR